MRGSCHAAKLSATQHLTIQAAAVVLIALSNCTQLAPEASHASWAAPKLGVVVDEKLNVIDIDAGSPAEKAGIQKGGILISIGGVPFTEKEKADAVIQEFPGEAAYAALAKGEEWQGKMLPLVLERNGEKIELQIMPVPLTWWGLSPLPPQPP